MGLAKKVILANNLNIIVEAFFGSDIKNLSVTGTWYAVIIYAMQIYFDFSGYSDMAIGLGRIFGFHFDENFNYPFICKDVSEFWQRWHISLSTFFRDYLLYVPIFGKRRKYGGLFLVWFCTGLWHGASWNYIIWGLYFGMFIFIEQLIGKKKMKKVITYGTFDLLHVGHINLLRRAKALGDYLIVVVSSDEFNAGKGKKAYHSFEDRKKILEAIRYVDEVLPEYTWEQKIDDIVNNNVDVFVMGDDWKGKFDFLKDYCEVVYLPRTEGISTTKIKNDLNMKD